MYIFYFFFFVFMVGNSLIFIIIIYCLFVESKGRVQRFVIYRFYNWKVCLFVLMLCYVSVLYVIKRFENVVIICIIVFVF